MASIVLPTKRGLHWKESNSLAPVIPQQIRAGILCLYVSYVMCPLFMLIILGEHRWNRSTGPSIGLCYAYCRAYVACPSR